MYLNKWNQFVVNMCTFRLKKTTSWTQFMKEIQFLLLKQRNKLKIINKNHKFCKCLELKKVKISKHTFPIFLWSLLAASSWNFCHSFNCLLSGNEMPYTRWRVSASALPSQYVAEFYKKSNIKIIIIFK